MTRAAALADRNSLPSGASGVAEVCPLLGAPCPAAERLAARLVAAVRAARAVAGPEFRFDGRAEIDGCGARCEATVTTTADAVRLDCASGATLERPLRAAHRLI